MGTRFAIWWRYPKVEIRPSLPPDMQGPVDLCRAAVVSRAVIDSIDVPTCSKTAALVVQPYIQFMGEWIKIAPSARFGQSLGAGAQATSCPAG